MTEPAAEAATGRAADQLPASAASPGGAAAVPVPTSQVHVRDPAGLVELAPYLLGFHPKDSVVLIAFPADGNQVCLTARADLAEARRPGFVDYLAALVAQAGGRRLVVVVYGAAPPAVPPAARAAPAALPERDAVDQIAEAGRLVDIALLGAYYVSAGHWWSYDPCGNATCCPAAGTPLRGDHSAAVAAAVFAGMTALPDRAALGAALEPVDAEQRRELAEAVVVAEQEMVSAAAAGVGIGPWRTGALVLLRSVLSRLSDEHVPWLAPIVAGRLVVALTDAAVRDVAWAWTNEICQCGPAGELWRQLARRAEEPYNAPPLFLAAWAAWRAGQGAVALVTLERTLAADPEYSAALMLEQLISQGYDPANAGSLVAPCPLPASALRERRRRRDHPPGATRRASAERG